MKTLSLFAAFLLSVSSLQAATSVVETFDCDAGNYDNGAPGNDNEVLSRMIDATTTLGTGFVWGGYAPSSADGATGANNTQSAIYGVAAQEQLALKNSAIYPGARAYTRFDTTATLTGTCNNSSVTIDASAADAGCKLTVVAPIDPLIANTQLAILIHNADGWYQSSPLTISTTMIYEFNTATKVTWQKLDSTHAAVADMNQVDKLGETGSTIPALIAGTVSPTLTAIDGMGIIVTTGTPNTTKTLLINDMTLGAGVVSLTGVSDWAAFE